MSDKLLFGGRTLEGEPLNVNDFKVNTFDRPSGVGVPEQPHLSVPVELKFEEFERPKTPKKGFEPDKESSEPSLGYLFTPFDPGNLNEKKFDILVEPPKEKIFDYKDLDLRDAGVINTLERANAKAKQIIVAAIEEAKRREESLTAIAKQDAEKLTKELTKEVKDKAAQLEAKLKLEAESLLTKAKNEAAAIEAQAQNTVKIKQQAEALLAENQAKAEALKKDQESLAARQIQIDNLQKEIKSQKEQAESKMKSEVEVVKTQAVQAARLEGLEKGRLEGRKLGREETLKRAANFFHVIGLINSLWENLWRQNAPFMVDLAVEAAEAIVNTQIENGRGLAAGAFSACVEYLQKCHNVVFKVRPEDLNEIEAARRAFKDDLDGLVNIEFKADPGLGPGDLIMESDAGRLDVTIKNRKARVMGVLRESLANATEADLPPEIVPEPLVIGLVNPLSDQAIEEYFAAVPTEAKDEDGESHVSADNLNALQEATAASEGPLSAKDEDGEVLAPSGNLNSQPEAVVPETAEAAAQAEPVSPQLGVTIDTGE
ncbi:MAG: hypothetical protein LBV23_02935 [Deltaproteobacteria bacterium]|nr:hypothetical protein [Deltaproteobacteria bacterium]